MKNKYTITLLLTGIILSVSGIALENLRMAGSSILIAAGAALKIVSILLLMTKILSDEKYRDFRES